MQERASLVGATIQIESARGRGTTILVRIAASGKTDHDA
jgi:signal transduction histidine kinase